MHLDHAIPWITISKLFSVRQNDKPLPAQDGTLRFAEDLNPCNKPNQDKELLYFSNAIANVIKEFSTTERKKYPVQFPAESSGELFPDELLQKRFASNQEYAAHGDTYLTEQNQRLEYWIRRAHGEREPDTSFNPSKAMFSCFDLDLADAVKILIIENHMSAEGLFVPRDIFADMGRMKEYLKLCFAVLYRYDMAAKEYGREHDWLRAIADALGQLNVNISHYYW
ncbi:hypothetical protein BGZ91_010648 [Linnemannia elongata]|nr:hypothetical protein BGZ91_010648 [Linnemannia elongata]